MLGLTSTITKPAEGYPQYRTKNSAEFTDARNNYISFTNHADFRYLESDFSFSGWVKFTADATSSNDKDARVVIDFGNGSNGGVELYYNDSSGDDEKMQVIIGVDGGSSSTLSSATDIDHGQWYHFAFSYDDSATTGKFYINGVLDTTKTDHGAIVNNTASAFLIGGTKFASSMSGYQCEIISWKGIALSAEQIAGIYNNGRPRHGLSCERAYIKGYWKLNSADDTGSDNVLDSSGNGHHGTTATGTGAIASADFDTTDVPSSS